MKKFLPIILLVLGVLVFVVVFFVVRGKKKKALPTEESALIEVSLDDRPVVSLTPSEDGHWLTLKIEKIVIDADSMDFELLYQVPDGPTQGVPGSVDIAGKNSFEAELLLGSESSGKFRYDEGVSEGTITLRFRNEKGKLLIKFKSDFHLQSDTKNLSSVDEKFSYTLDDNYHDFYVVMETIGVPKEISGDVKSGPYGIFSYPREEKFNGEVSLDGDSKFLWTGTKWEDLENDNSSDIGIFVGVGE